MHPNWGIFKGEWPYQNEWDYTVAVSLLTVNKVYNPSGFFSNAYVQITNYIEYWQGIEVKDFDAQARVGWEQGQHHSIMFGVGHDLAPIYIMYENRPNYEYPIIRASFKNFGGKVETQIPAPTEGFHGFRITRFGNQRSAFVNGELILQGNQDQGINKFYGPQFTFGGPKNEDSPLFAPLYVDYVTVVPEPVTVSALSFGIMFMLFKRRNMKSR